MCGDVDESGQGPLGLGFAGRGLGGALDPHFAFVFDERKDLLDLGERVSAQQLHLPGQIAFFRIEAVQWGDAIDLGTHPGFAQGREFVDQTGGICTA